MAEEFRAVRPVGMDGRIGNLDISVAESVWNEVPVLIVRIADEVKRGSRK
jgi:hypothetical protein